MRSLILALTSFALLAACAETETPPETDSGFIRMPAPGANMTAAYLTITRDEADALVAVEIQGVERAELHVAFEEDGISRMRQVERYDLSAGEPLVLEPGGRHLMLIGLDDAMEDGEMREVRLSFSSGVEEVIELPVRNRMAGGHSGH